MNTAFWIVTTKGSKAEYDGNDIYLIRANNEYYDIFGYENIDNKNSIQTMFEGEYRKKLDLLLHLIDINKIDIYDIPIAMITDQYMDYIHRMQIEDMDVTSDFLVMAATLLRIKSKMLLPVEKADAEETGEDPRMELVNRLLEYKTYKYRN